MKEDKEKRGETWRDIRRSGHVDIEPSRIAGIERHKRSRFKNGFPTRWHN